MLYLVTPLFVLDASVDAYHGRSGVWFEHVSLRRDVLVAYYHNSHAQFHHRSRHFSYSHTSIQVSKSYTCSILFPVHVHVSVLCYGDVHVDALYVAKLSNCDLVNVCVGILLCDFFPS